MRTLVLAGTLEARAVVSALVKDRRVKGYVSLARADRPPRSYGWPVVIGGWDDETDFTSWLIRQRIDTVIDATHPFATTFSGRVMNVARLNGFEYIRLLRPSWVPNGADRWSFLNDESEAAAHIPKGARVLVTTGREKIGELANLEGRELIFRVRESETDPFPFPNGVFRHDPPPYTLESETQLFCDLGIDWLLTRNSGGTGSWPKIEAARELGLPVAMIRRPRQPEGPRAQTVAEVIQWVRRRL